MATAVAPRSVTYEELVEDAELRLSQATTTLITEQPFFASILMHVPRRAVTWLNPPTMATDGRELVYAPEFVVSITRKQLVGVLCHEVCHIAGLHPFRKGTRQLKGWNYACDYVVNAIVLDNKLELPPGCLPPIRDKCAEELYKELPDDDDDCMFGPGGFFEPKNASGQALSEPELEELMAQAKVMVQQALNAAEKAGHVPAGIKRMVSEALEPRVPWRELLAQFIDQFTRNDYSWTHTNRRYSGSQFIFPGLRTPSIGKVIMANDMSGSIDREQARQIAGELLGCMEIYAEQGEDPELTVAWFDHAVYPQVVSNPDDIAPQGGGGTSYSVIFDWMREAGENPLGVVVVTDGYCNDFGKAPECPVLWILLRPNRAFKPPFGTVAYTIDN